MVYFEKKWAYISYEKIGGKSMSIRKLIWLCVAMMLSVGFAAYTNVAAGTSIISTGKSVTLSYTVAGVTRNANSAVTASATVTLNGGIKIAGATWMGQPNTNNILPGTAASYTFSLINSGNFTDTVVAQIANTSGGFAGTWASGLSSANIVISREGVVGLTLVVTADPAALDGDTGSLAVSLNGSMAGAFYKQYTGSNAYTYGSSSNSVTLLSFRIAAPSISITKSVTVQAPADYVAKGGNPTDPVPGAALAYGLAYYNYGSATGNSVEIVDVIPSNTEFASAAGGTIQYSNDGGATWGYTPSGTVDPAVTTVKWVIGDVATSSGGTVTLNVVIK
jgi:uncharacterized repeat protein (TIGR01451 family)